MRPRSVVATVGYALVGLIVGGLVLTIILALLAGQPFYGRNVYGLPLGTYSTAAVLVIAGVIGVVRLVQKARQRHGR
jgi:hypothetical protein